MQLDLYQQFIHKSRYARFLPDKNRRENWDETVDRYMINVVDQKAAALVAPIRNQIREAIYSLSVMPSMRCMMTAGKALDRDNTAGYNCAYLPVDDPKSFDETMFILMCGTGVGFSVERQYINKLPEVPDQLFPSDTNIIVKDSKEGWAKGLRQLIALLYSGEIPTWDTSRLRGAGAVLKTFGGRSSGPAPLEELFHFVVNVFKNAAGRKLTSVECHDIQCKIGEVVVVGGVRRSAMISLSNLSDDRMRSAKSGEWWKQYAHRSLANNSACYNEKPDVGMFMEEWLALYQSKSGERGIFNREAAQLKANNGRRDPEHEFGTNPCSEIILRPYQFCNLTEIVARSTDTFEDLERKVVLATILGTIQATLTHFPYLRKIWTKNTEEERLLGVSITGIYDNPLLNNPDDDRLPARLNKLQQLAIDTNKIWAEKLGIPQSVAITCVKPSGTVSELVDSASGIHPRFAHQYIRRVRADKKDPLTQFMIDNGVVHENDLMKPEATTVFSFAKDAPETSTLKKDVQALDHLKLWLVYQTHWCEHKPSVTVSVKETEWPSVGAFVWDNFDQISGISFLPYDGGTYRQAPFEQVDKTTHFQLKQSTPTVLDWDSLIEQQDNVEGAQMLACSAAGGCTF